MISFAFSILNPWAKDRDQKDYILWDRSLSKNWALEFQFSKMPMYEFVSVSVNISWAGRDHAGPQLILELFGYFVNFNIYNKNHWNYETGQWEIYEQDK